MAAWSQNSSRYADQNMSVPSRPDANSEGNSSARQREGGHARTPANVQLISGQSSVNINIHNIHGSVSVGNRNTIDYCRSSGSTLTQRVVHGTNDDSESDSDSSSSDDSEAERFFAARGLQKPSRNVFRDMKNSAKHKKVNVQSTRRVHTLVVNNGLQPAAYDRHGRPVAMGFQTTTPAGRSSAHTPGAPRSTPATPEQKPAPAESVVTSYEQQTQAIRSIMREVRQPNRIVDEVMIQRISPLFGRGWRRVFRQLDFHDALIDVVFEESNGVVQDTVHKLLVKWTRRCEAPNIHTLVEALVRAEQFHSNILDILKS